MQEENHAQFFTSTIHEWVHLLEEDAVKDIITSSLSFLVEAKRVDIYSFVIVSNHLHIIWRNKNGHKQSDVQRDFLRFTGQKINYIHDNPVKAGLCKLPEEYKYSSASFYETGIKNWNFLTHYYD